MNARKRQQSSWPRQSAIVVSESPNVHMLLRELLRSYDWTVIDSTPSVDKAVGIIKQGLAHLMIIDDTVEVPSIAHQRYLLTDPVAALTPVLTFCSDFHKHERPAIANIGHPVIVDKPLTPSKFVPGFVKLVKQWDQQPFYALRRANYQFLNGNEQTGLKLLLKLKEVPLIQHMASQALALHIRRLGKVKEAETVMLHVLRNAPRNLGTMLSLGDLYMHASMPALAQRLFIGARNMFPTSCGILPDLVQSSMLKGDIEMAIKYLEQMHEREFLPEQTQSFLARLLYTEGREQEAESVLNNNKASFRRIQMGWEKAETSQREAS